MPAAAVITAPGADEITVAVKKLLVGLQESLTVRSSNRVCLCELISGRYPFQGFLEGTWRGLFLFTYSETWMLIAKLALSTLEEDVGPILVGVT